MKSMLGKVDLLSMSLTRATYSRRPYLLLFCYLAAFHQDLYSIHSRRDLRYALAKAVFHGLSVALDLYALATLHVVRV